MILGLENRLAGRFFAKITKKKLMNFTPTVILPCVACGVEKSRGFTDMEIESVKERLKVNTEKLKLITAIIVLLTSGLIGMLFRDMDGVIRILLFGMGAVADIFAVVYLWQLNNSIEELLSCMEGHDV